MNKPLKDWTRGEIKAECKKHGNKHTGCVFWADGGAVGYCRLEDALDKTYPEAWDLAEPPRWTEQDMKDAKALKRLIADAHHVWRGDGLNNTPLLYDEYEDQMWILNDCFAALPPRANITLDEIIGGAE